MKASPLAPEPAMAITGLQHCEQSASLNADNFAVLFKLNFVRFWQYHITQL